MICLFEDMYKLSFEYCNVFSVKKKTKKWGNNVSLIYLKFVLSAICSYTIISIKFTDLSDQMLEENYQCSSGGCYFQNLYIRNIITETFV